MRTHGGMTERTWACPMRSSITGHIRRQSDVLAWPHRCAVLALACGLDPIAVREVELIAAELASNTLRHGGGGEVHAAYSEQPARCIELTATDDGPGFDDIEHALMDGVSRGRRVEELAIARGEGLGAGLGAIGRLADELFVSNKLDGGAVVIARKYLP